MTEFKAKKYQEETDKYLLQLFDTDWENIPDENIIWWEYETGKKVPLKKDTFTPILHVPELKGYFQFVPKITEGGQHRYVETGRLKSDGPTTRVYKFQDLKTGRIVAGKLAFSQQDDEDTWDTRLLSLAQARKLAGLVHPNIAVVFDLAMTNNRGSPEAEELFYIMEWLSGGDLFYRVREELSLTEVEEVIKQIGDGLQFIHDQGYIYADLKPDNIIFSGDGIAKLIDVGITTKMDKAGKAVIKGGNDHFVSPEQRNWQPVDIRTDVYSLGANIYFMLTGKTDFALRNRWRDSNDPLPVLEHYKAEFTEDTLSSLSSVLRKSLNLNPEDRFTSVRETVSEFTSFFPKNRPL